MYAIRSYYEIEERTGVPVLGVVPWIELRLPEEDSLALSRKRSAPGGNGVLQIGVVRLPPAVIVRYLVGVGMGDLDIEAVHPVVFDLEVRNNFV